MPLFVYNISRENFRQRTKDLHFISVEKTNAGAIKNWFLLHISTNIFYEHKDNEGAQTQAEQTYFVVPLLALVLMSSEI